MIIKKSDMQFTVQCDGCSKDAHDIPRCEQEADQAVYFAIKMGYVFSPNGLALCPQCQSLNQLGSRVK